MLHACRRLRAFCLRNITEVTDCLYTHFVYLPLCVSACFGNMGDCLFTAPCMLVYAGVGQVDGDVFVAFDRVSLQTRATLSAWAHVLVKQAPSTSRERARGYEDSSKGASKSRGSPLLLLHVLGQMAPPLTSTPLPSSSSSPSSHLPPVLDSRAAHAHNTAHDQCFLNLQ